MSSITDLYQTYLGRTPTPVEESFWNQQAASGANIQSAISGSPEASSYSSHASSPTVNTQVVSQTPVDTPPPLSQTVSQAAVAPTLTMDQKLQNYGWDNLINTIQSDPTYQQAQSSDHGADNTYVNVPGIGEVLLDSNGRINVLDMDSALAYQKTGNAPVYNTIWDGRDQETGKYNGSAPSTYQVSHGGLSAETLGAIAAIAITAGYAAGAIPGLGTTAADTAGALGTTAGTYSAPTAAELAANGYDIGGMGITGGGANSIGSASSLVDAGIGGSAGYGTSAVTGLDNIYSNEGTHYPDTASTATSPVNATTGTNAAPTVPLTPSVSAPYSNEGTNYPTTASTATSPINATTGTTAAPTVPLTTGIPTTTGVPPINLGGGGIGTSTGTGGGSNNLGSLASLLYSMYSRNNIANQLKGTMDTINGMYKPGSDEANWMQHELEARDAAAGRRSQYGPRSVELNSKLAQARMSALNSPAYLALQGAYLNNAPGSGGLSDLFGAMSSGTNGGNLINSILNSVISGYQNGNTASNFISNNASLLNNNSDLSINDLYGVL